MFKLSDMWPQETFVGPEGNVAHGPFRPSFDLR